MTTHTYNNALCVCVHIISATVRTAESGRIFLPFSAGCCPAEINKAAQGYNPGTAMQYTNTFSRNIYSLLPEIPLLLGIKKKDIMCEGAVVCCVGGVFSCIGSQGVGAPYDLPFLFISRFTLQRIFFGYASGSVVVSFISDISIS